MINEAADYARSWMKSAQDAARRGKMLHHCMKIHLKIFKISSAI